MTIRQSRIAKKISDALNTLAKLGSADAIAAYFESVCLHGKHHNGGTGCPVRNYIVIKTGIVVESAVTYEVAAGKASVETPKVVSDFMVRFDRGDYKTLIA